VCAGFAAAAAGGGWLWAFAAYLGLAITTAAAVRSVSQEPGSWLGRRAARRLLVGAIAGTCAALVACSIWPSLARLSLVLVVALLLLDVALGQATQRVATAADDIVDERQEALRNRAHRLAYQMFGVATAVVLVGADVATPQTRAWLGSALASTLFIVFLQLGLVLPAMVMAWLEPDRLEPEGRARDRWVPIAFGLLALTVITPFALSLAMVALPPLTTSSVSPVTDRCTRFMADTRIGVGVEAVIPLHTVVCWDATRSQQSFGLNLSDCHPSSSAMTDVVTERCSRTTSPEGTVEFTYRARIRPKLLPFLSRDVTMGLAVDRNGRIVSFP
jgi:hypothetical protein